MGVGRVTGGKPDILVFTAWKGGDTFSYPLWGRQRSTDERAGEPGAWVTAVNVIRSRGHPDACWRAADVNLTPCWRGKLRGCSKRRFKMETTQRHSKTPPQEKVKEGFTTWESLSQVWHIFDVVYSLFEKCAVAVVVVLVLCSWGSLVCVVPILCK